MDKPVDLNTLIAPLLLKAGWVNIPDLNSPGEFVWGDPKSKRMIAIDREVSSVLYHHTIVEKHLGDLTNAELQDLSDGPLNPADPDFFKKLEELIDGPQS